VIVRYIFNVFVTPNGSIIEKLIKLTFYTCAVQKIRIILHWP